ncbi:hypothetical protein TNCV_4147831 [Trichonephila clavipes]|nr:hypothetical protein TNCV_4147831 [Trichonephila clavipes]
MTAGPCAVDLGHYTRAKASQSQRWRFQRIHVSPRNGGFREETIVVQTERDAKGRDSGFTGQKSRFSVNVEVNRLSDNLKYVP